MSFILCTYRSRRATADTLRSRLVVACAVIPLLLGLAGRADATTHNWTGLGTDSNTSTPHNWQGDALPADGDDLMFPAGVSQTNVTQDLPIKFDHIFFATTGGAVYHLSGSVTVMSDIEVISGEADLTGSLTLYQNGGTTNDLNFSANAVGSELAILSAINGTALATLHTIGPGRITLAGANTYLGATMVESGILRVETASALGPASGAHAFVNDGTLELASPGGPIDKPLVFASGTTLLATVGNSLTGSINLLSQLTSINVAASQVLALRGLVYGHGSFTKDGPGDLLFNGMVDNTVGDVVGPAIANAGTIHLMQFAPGADHVALPFGVTINNGASVIHQANNQITGNVIVNNGGQLSMQTFQDTITRLDGPAGGTVGFAGGSLNVGFGVFAGALTGTGVLNAVNGTLFTLSGTSTFTGEVWAINQALQVTGTLAGKVVLQGGSIFGTGTTGPVENFGQGTVQPGPFTGTGTLHMQSLKLTSGRYTVQAFQNPGGPAWSKTAVTGTVTLGDGSATGTTFAPQFDPSISTVPAAPIVIIDNQGSSPVVGTFTGYPEGSSFTLGTLTYYISYHGGDGNDVVLTATPPQQTPTYDYYLSEGSTGSFFTTDVLIANPNTSDASVTMTFYTQNIGVTTKTLTVPAMQRVTITLNNLPEAGQGAVSTVVHSNDNLPLIVERTMSWDKSGYGASGDKAVTGTSTNWYFAEGSQGFFSTFVLLANPQTTANNALVTYYREGDTPVTRTYALAPQSRTTIDVSTEPALANHSFGMQVQFDAPAIAERSMYFGTSPIWSGGHESAGTSTLSYDWVLAEGATGSFFETYILMANPNNTDAHVAFTYLPAGGAPIIKNKTVSANSRMTIDIATEDPALASAAVATQIHSDVPLVAERSQYWPNPAPQWYEAHNSFGVAVPGKKWGLSEGRVGQTAAYQTYILLANPGATAANVTIQFLRENGAAPITKTFAVQPTTRLNVAITGPGSDVPELANENFGAIITADRAIAVERSMYSNAIGQIWAAGTNATASPLP